MAIKDDGDIIRGLGFVTIYAAWLEDRIDDVLRTFSPIRTFDEREQKKPISVRIKKALELIRKIGSNDIKDLEEGLHMAKKLFKRRNDYIHGRIFVDEEGVVCIRDARTKGPVEPITSRDQYSLANDIWALKAKLAGPLAFRLPRAISEYIDGSR